MNDRFNNYIKDVVDNYESDVDPLKILEGVNKKRGKKNKKDRLILFLILLVGLSVGLFNFLDLPSSMQMLTENNTQSVNKAIESTTSIENTEIDLDVENSNDITSNNNLNHNLSTSKKNSQKTKGHLSSNLLNNKNKLYNSKKSTSQSNIHSPLVKAYEQNFLNNNLSARHSKSVESAPETFQSQSLNSDVEPIRMPLYNRMSLSYYRDVPDLLASFDIEVKSQNIITFKESFVLSMSSGIGTLNQSISIATNDEQLLDQSISSLRPSHSVSAAITLGFQLNSSWRVYSGISYSKLYSDFDWKGTYLQDQDGQRAILQSSGQPYTIPSNLSGVYFEEITREISTLNSLQYIDIPIGITYLTNLGSLRANINAGTSINILNTSSGFILDDNGVPIELTKEHQNSIGLNYSFGAGVSYPFNTKILFNLQGIFSYRQHLIDHVSLTNLVNEIQIGISYKL